MTVRGPVLPTYSRFTREMVACVVFPVTFPLFLVALGRDNGT